jgi:flagellar hook-associated protein 3 FlgL
VSITGAQLMGTGTDNLNQILTDFETALNTNADTATLSSFMTKLQGKQQDVLSSLADVGGREKRLEMMSNANDDDKTNYTQALSNVEDVDQAQATMDFKMAEAVYRSALQVGAQVIQPTLLDFLK